MAYINGKQILKVEVIGSGMDEFWDVFQQNGTRTLYDDAFRGVCWVDEIFKPKYPLNNIESAANMFNQTHIKNIEYDLDFTNATNMNYAFAYSQTERIKSIKFGTRCSINNTFTSASKLKDLTVVGNLYLAANFKDCTLLTHDSLMSIINALANVVNKTITLGETNLAKLTDAEKAIATEKGWTLA